MGEGMSIQIAARVSHDNELFGSIGTKEIVAALAKSGVEVDGKQIHLHDKLKKLGKFQIDVRLHKNVAVQVTLEIVNSDPNAPTLSETLAAAGKDEAAAPEAKAEKPAKAEKGAKADKPEAKAGDVATWLRDDYGLGRGHAMALWHVIRNGPAIGSKHVGTSGSHRDESDTLWLDGKATNPNP